MPPRRVGPYEIVSVIGRGGIGTVYRGHHRGSGLDVAVKVLGPSPAVGSTAARRLAREFEVLQSLDHPNVVRVFEAGVAEGYSFLAMELVEGLDLRAYLSPALDEEGEPASLGPRETALPPATASDPATAPVDPGPDAIRALAAMMDEPDTELERWPAPDPGAARGAGAEPAALAPEALAILNRPRRIARLTAALRQVLDALAYVHARGLVHRDLKPSNIMVDDRRRARLMDFGLVKAAGDADEEALTEAGRVVGTYRYMSPEQAQGYAVDARSDLYSVGVILYELLCGAPPFCAPDPVELWREILHVTPPSVRARNPGAEPALARIADRLLEKDPAHRFQGAAEVLAAMGDAPG